MSIIYRALLGSRGYGAHFNDSDWDYVAVCIEPESVKLGFKAFEQSERQSEKVTLLNYGLKKFLYIGIKGSPIVLETLFAKPVMRMEPYTTELLALRQFLVSKRTIRAYLGGAREALKSLENPRSRKKSAALINQFGYDTKVAYHGLRFAMMGRELATTGSIKLPMEPTEAQMLVSIRQGKWQENDVKNCLRLQIGLLENVLEGVCPIPEAPDEEKVEDWMMSVYRRQFKLF